MITSVDDERQCWTERQVETAHREWLNTPRWRALDRWLARRNYQRSRKLADAVAWRVSLPGS